ncbi:hypothetical protein OIV83_002138 [Microbotryomycetes sp. JL201]|nr:hypothetical protein OIV83_002138 [Microbotryomycetes sp. JL201]
MLMRGVLVAALAAVASAQLSNLKDVGNGVHVPGAIPANETEPLQHRLAFAGPTGVTVSWSSFAKLDSPTVFYGLKPSQLDKVASSGRSTTYPTSRTYNNHVKITGLQPNTVYYYKVSNTNTAGAAYRPLYTFRTARPAGDTTPFTIAAFADLGLMGPDGLSTRGCPNCPVTTLKPGETNTIQSLIEHAAEFEWMHHAGDYSYADYALKEAIQGYFEGRFSDTDLPTPEENAVLYESLNEQFFDQMQPVSAEKPWMGLPGNHEANSINGGYSPKKPLQANNITAFNYALEGQTNFTFYKEHFSFPSDESGGVGNFWYSFDYGLAHFIMLDTETDLGHGLLGPIENNTKQANGPFGLMDEQVNWLKQDLANVDRSKTPFVVAAMHRPFYISVKPDLYPAWQKAFEPIFVDNQVDVVLTGHVHVYERFAGMNNGTVDSNGWNNPKWPVYITNGAAGHYDGLDNFDKAKQNGSLAGIDGAYGWGKMTFHNATHLTYEYVASTNGTVLDSATLYKARNTTPGKPPGSPGKPPGAPGKSPGTPGKPPGSPGKGPSKQRRSVW